MIPYNWQQQSVDVFTYHSPNGNKLWDKSVNYIKDAVRHYSSWSVNIHTRWCKQWRGQKICLRAAWNIHDNSNNHPDAKEEKLDG
jgi:hypothetical protein